MARYIDADNLREESKMLYSVNDFEPVEAYTQDQIDNAPTADVQEVRRGKWIDGGYRKMCSLCGNAGNILSVYDTPTKDFAYCPFCGAKMEVEQ